MGKNLIFGIIGLIVLIGICAGFYLLGNMQAVQGMTIKRVTPGQIADAMQADDFYSNYRQSTLIVKGQVAAVAADGNAHRLTFKSDTAYKAFCDLSSTASVPKIGAVITVVANGGPAVRQPNGVLLVGCTIP